LKAVTKVDTSGCGRPSVVHFGSCDKLSPSETTNLSLSPSNYPESSVSSSHQFLKVMKKHPHHGPRFFQSLLDRKKGYMGSTPGTRPSKIIIERHGYTADIVASQSSHGQIWHYVIQPVGSRDIVHWGQEVSLQRAQECVEEFLSDYERRKA
jgi:hypothetical protein